MGSSRKRKCKRKNRAKSDGDARACEREPETAQREPTAVKRARVEVAATSSSSPTSSTTKGAAAVAASSDFPYPTDEDDHCESPLEAYQTIAPFLKRLESNSSRKTLTIYDPYFCNGAVREHLNQLGFDDVYNQKEDCYEQWKALTTSIGDVVVTNPPYSGVHIQHLMEYVTSHKHRDKPFFLLLPNWVVKKDYYQACTSSIQPFYLVPHKRYVYVPPKDFRSAKKSDTHKKSAPFISMWYCWGGTSSMNEQLMKMFYAQPVPNCDLARSKSALRDLRRKKR